MIELLTALAIVGTLMVVGVKSYQSQSNKTKTAQAKYYLSYVYSSEKQFKANWNSYYENLPVVGVVPEGPYSYDIGFKVEKAHHMDLEGKLVDYPQPKILNVLKCTTFFGLCDTGPEGCQQTAKKQTDGKDYFFNTGETFHCKVTAGQNLSDCSKSDCNNSFGNENVSGGADKDRFIAYAVSKLKNQDVWSVDHEKTFTHKKDGTR